MTGLMIFRKLLLLHLFMLSMFISVQGQEAVDSTKLPEAELENILVTEDQDTTQYKDFRVDKTELDKRYFDDQLFEKYENDSDYDYSVEQKEVRENKLLRRFLRWLSRKLQLRVGDKNYGFFFGILKFLLYLALLGIVIFIIVKMLKLGKFNISRHSKKLKDIPFDEIERNIHEVEFDPLIAEALKNGNYRAAVRLQHLKGLRQLSDKKLVEWSIEKTNKDYFYEIPEKDLKNKFKHLSSLYEYIWYGEFDIDQKTYSQVDDLYSNFYSSLNISHAK